MDDQERLDAIELAATLNALQQMVLDLTLPDAATRLGMTEESLDSYRSEVFKLSEQIQALRIPRWPPKP